MTFIGLIAEKKDESSFKKALETTLKKINVKAVVIVINESNIDNLKGVQFETIIINDNIKDKYFSELNRIVTQTKYLIINNDVVHVEKIKNMNLTVITYGFGNKCTVTTSSIEEEEIIICLQRSIYNIKGEIIEPQEIKGFIDQKASDKYIQMVISVIKFIYFI